MTKSAQSALVLFAIAVVSVIAYLPAINNNFISDDYGIFPMLNAWGEDPLKILETPSELFRITSYIYFWSVLQLFGLRPEPYYIAGIAIHALISCLVYFLVLRWTGLRPAAASAGLFFAAYERHQEAVMWISAMNDTILTLNCLLFLLLWERAISRENPSRYAFGASLIVFALALFSKEGSAALAPVAIISLLLHGYRRRELASYAIPVLVMVTAFGLLWLSLATRNFFVAEGFYALGFQFIPVYARAVARLMAQAAPFLVLFFAFRRRVEMKDWKRSLIYFAAILAFAIIPYSFLTYLDHLPSRHTYFPSVGLAGLIGISFAGVHRWLSGSAKQAYAALFATLIIANMGYIWLKKDQQFVARAAPTEDLFRILNEHHKQISRDAPVVVCGFPIEHAWWLRETISKFTPVAENGVVLQDDCTRALGSGVVVWNPSADRYIADFRIEREPSSTMDAVVEDSGRR